jgi:hypothetical protein
MGLNCRVSNLQVPKDHPTQECHDFQLSIPNFGNANLAMANPCDMTAPPPHFVHSKKNALA